MKIALVGYGRMGHAVEAEARAAGHEVVARFDPNEPSVGTISLADALAGAEVAVDFTVAEQVAGTAAAVARAGVGLVVGTTGWGEDTAAALREAAGSVGIVYGPNFSEGVHVFLRLAREAARLVEAVGGYDVHVHEIHHRHKRDHPSGTAGRLADVLIEALSSKGRWQAGPPRHVAERDTLYVTSTRAGEVPGIHVVGIEGGHDRMELRHEARGREAFARGAVRAAEWIRGRRGLFTFEEMMDEFLAERSTGEDDD